MSMKNHDGMMMIQENWYVHQSSLATYQQSSGGKLKE
jgi:hypothetical protein